MRVIGHLESENDARVFSDFLYVQGIENELDRDGKQWAVWVHSDDQLESARGFMEEFRAAPNDPRFRQTTASAEKLRDAAKADDAAYRKRVVDARKMFPGLSRHGFGPVTYALIFASLTVFVLSRFGKDLERLSPLLIAKMQAAGDSATWLREIRQGEVWRLFTPIIIHFGIPHILFNMLWLRELGSLLEARLGSWYLAAFVFIVAAASNFGQYIVSGNPIFGGMSGVVYALIGYVWARGRFDPAAGLFLDRQTMLFALIWFAACFTGWLGPIANTAHTVGLVLGLLWAFVDSKRG